VPDFWITQLNYIGLYAMVALGLVLLTGVAGLTSFGQAAFVGRGRLHGGLPGHPARHVALADAAALGVALAVVAGAGAGA
jgi:branched-chain amino acid transport system permease protein